MTNLRDAIRSIQISNPTLNPQLTLTQTQLTFLKDAAQRDYLKIDFLQTLLDELAESWPGDTKPAKLVKWEKLRAADE